MVVDVARLEDLCAVNPERGVDTGPPADHRHLDPPLLPLDHPPVGGRRAVAQRRARPARLHRRQEPPLDRNVGVADGVHTAVDLMEAAASHPRRDRTAGQTASGQLAQ